jgi:hypothetical protein
MKSSRNEMLVAFAAVVVTVIFLFAIIEGWP